MARPRKTTKPVVEVAQPKATAKAARKSVTPPAAESMVRPPLKPRRRAAQAPASKATATEAVPTKQGARRTKRVVPASVRVAPAEGAVATKGRTARVVAAKPASATPRERGTVGSEATIVRSVSREGASKAGETAMAVAGAKIETTAGRRKPAARRSAPRQRPAKRPQPAGPDDRQRVDPDAPLPLGRTARPLSGDRDGATFVQLFARDPREIVAFWQTAPGSLARLRADVGERTFALSRPTLRVTDERGQRPDVILLPPGTRSWSIPTDARRLAYRVEFGYLLPSGEFRRLAESATIRPPSPPAPSRRAPARARYEDPVRPALTESDSRRRIEAAIAAGDWARARAIAEGAGPETTDWLSRRIGAPRATSAGGGVTVGGGASDVHRR